ncbi:MAG: response regulator, partial [Alphaproteobacteria bacterium]|nr:response regulator [Alphaproteobacteria bacterium]
MENYKEVKILLVEDEEAHAELIRMNLGRSGLSNHIAHFANGLQFVDFLFNEESESKHQEAKYLVILDINMPGLDGRQVLERIKNDKRTRNIPVIMLTTTEDEKEIQRCYALGCNLYLTKPMDYEAFCNAVHELGLFIQTAKFPRPILLS